MSTDPQPARPTPSEPQPAPTTPVAETSSWWSRPDARAPAGAEPDATSSPFGRLATRIWVGIGIVYVLAVGGLRFSRGFAPYVANGDWKQWVWHYNRYFIDGAFPPGQPLTDYAFTVQPPLWYAVMATASHLMRPTIVANALSFVAYFISVYAAYRAVKERTNTVLAVTGVMLTVRFIGFAALTTGGYPRSFGPSLTLLFLAAFIANRHRAVLGVLLVMGALYPSVLVPCGLAYGIWCLVAWRPGKPLLPWLRTLVETGVTGLTSAAIGSVQNLLAPAWFGSVVTYAEALQMTELTSRGRTGWVPHPPFWRRVAMYVEQPWDFSGITASHNLLTWNHARTREIFLGMLVCAGVGALLRRRKLPLQLAVFGISILISYWIARELAFRLYLPYRVVQHTLPYLVVVSIPIFWYAFGRGIFATRRAATIFALALGTLPVFLLTGDGLEAGGFKKYTRYVPLYQYLEKNTPPTAQFAGTLRVLDEIPLFAGRQAYVNWMMAHPFRKGYYAEIDRRMMAMADAYYATSIADVLAFADREHVDYFIVDRQAYQAVPAGSGNSELYQPLGSKVKALWAARRAQGFALDPPPPESVVHASGGYQVVDVARLRALAAAAQLPAGAAPDAPSTGPVSPDADGSADDDGAPEP